MKVGQTDSKAQKGKPGHRAMQESKRFMLSSGTGQAGHCRMPPGCLIRHSTQRMGKP